MSYLTFIIDYYSQCGKYGNGLTFLFMCLLIFQILFYTFSLKFVDDMLCGFDVSEIDSFTPVVYIERYLSLLKKKKKVLLK